MFHTTEDGQLPQGPQRKYSIFEYIGIFFDSVYLARFAMLHPVDLPVRPASHDIHMQEAIVIDTLRLHLEWLHRRGRSVGASSD